MLVQSSAYSKCLQQNITSSVNKSTGYCTCSLISTAIRQALERDSGPDSGPKFVWVTTGGLRFDRMTGPSILGIYLVREKEVDAILSKLALYFVFRV